MTDIARWLRHEATSNEPDFMGYGHGPTERYQKLMEASDEIERLTALLAEGIEHADSADADLEWIRRARAALEHKP